MSAAVAVAKMTHVITEITPAGLMVNGKFMGLIRAADLDPAQFVWECDKPSWFDAAFSELQWARSSGERRNAVLLGRSAAILHPYALTLRNTISDFSNGWRYDPYLEGFLINSPDRCGNNILGLCQDYDIALSPALRDVIEGFEDSLEIVRQDAQVAIDAGFRAPENFASGRTLEAHQIEAVLTLAHNGGGLLADQVGLGKGGEFVCGLLCQNEYLQRHGKEPNWPAIVAVTSSMKEEIAEEITKWDNTSKVTILEGTKSAVIDSDSNWVVVNHDILDKRMPDILKLKPRAFIADEAHVYKNIDTNRYNAAQRLATKVRQLSKSIASDVRSNTEHPYVVMATGTPFLNYPRELYGLLSILNWEERLGAYAKRAYAEKHDGSTRMRTRVGGHRNNFVRSDSEPKLRFEMKELWNQRAFEVQWCGGYYDQFGAWQNNGASNSRELNKLLLDLGMIRRRKSDVIKPLPPLVESPHLITLSDRDMKTYAAIENDFRKWFIDGVRARLTANGESARSRAAIGRAIGTLERGEAIMRMTALRETLAMMKVPHTVEWIHRFMRGDIEGWDPSRRKLIVYVHHDKARQALISDPSLQQYNPVHILPSVQQKQKLIQEHKRRFQEDESVRLIVCTMAAREGHTLTAAKDVYLHEIPFVPSWIVQMAGRCWARFSELFRPHEAFLHYAIAEGTVDSSLLRMNVIKKAMFSAVIDGEGQDTDDNDLNPFFEERRRGETHQQARKRSGEKLLRAFAIGIKDLEVAR